MNMQEKLYEIFVQAYYEPVHHAYSNGRHDLFAWLLEEEFDINVSTEQAKHYAESIAREGIVVVRDSDEIKEIIG